MHCSRKLKLPPELIWEIVKKFHFDTKWAVLRVSFLFDLFTWKKQLNWIKKKLLAKKELDDAKETIYKVAAKLSSAAMWLLLGEMNRAIQQSATKSALKYFLISPTKSTADCINLKMFKQSIVKIIQLMGNADVAALKNFTKCLHGLALEYDITQAQSSESKFQQAPEKNPRAKKRRLELEGPPEAKEQFPSDNKCTLFVLCLPDRITEKGMSLLFGARPGFVSCTLVKGKNGAPVGVLVFKSRMEAEFSKKEFEEANLMEFSFDVPAQIQGIYTSKVPLNQLPEKILHELRTMDDFFSFDPVEHNSYAGKYIITCQLKMYAPKIPNLRLVVPASYPEGEEVTAERLTDSVGLDLFQYVGSIEDLFRQEWTTKQAHKITDVLVIWHNIIDKRPSSSENVAFPECPFGGIGDFGEL